MVQKVYELSAQRGRRKGSVVDDWLAAEDIVMNGSPEANARRVTRSGNGTHDTYRAGYMVASALLITPVRTSGLKTWDER